jgi:hypothetical protein
LASTGRAFGLPFMRNSDIRYADTVPSAVGGITRFACEYAKEHGIDVEALLQKSGLTLGQIEQPSVRLSVRSQIKFLELAAFHACFQTLDGPGARRGAAAIELTLLRPWDALAHCAI